jgi:hypothetical protein
MSDYQPCSEGVKSRLLNRRLVGGVIKAVLATERFGAMPRILGLEIMQYPKHVVITTALFCETVVQLSALSSTQ